MEDNLKALLSEYTETYGDRFVRHGEAEFSKESLERIASWRL
jgi:hypothetical protein